MKRTRRQSPIAEGIVNERIATMFAATRVKSIPD
jgi:hypothetical protein